MLLATELFFVLTSLLLAAAAIRGSASAWRLQNQPIDLAMQILGSLWLAFLLTSMTKAFTAGPLGVIGQSAGYLQTVIFECLIASLAFFVLSASATVRPWILFVLLIQVAVGLIALGWAAWQDKPSSSTEVFRMVWHLASATLVTALTARHTRYTHSRRSWLALAVCGMGLGSWLYQAVEPSSSHTVLPLGWHLYAFFLFVVWKLVSLNPDADKSLGLHSNPFGGITSYQPFTSVTTDDEFVSLAVRGERQRIAYELHDNVGSQITSILFAMQAADKPHKRQVMLSLEQCLSDLKMLVDALDCFDENVSVALGRLRYRIQHALDRQSIEMRWNVQIGDELDSVRGVHAQQVLRIAQESLANVMRHAGAKSVRVVCSYIPEFGHLVLEVRDDGIGIATEQLKNPTGRGLKVMKRRAAAIGGFLAISSRQNEGTCVRLTLPLPHLTSGTSSSIPTAAPVTETSAIASFNAA
jgi:signal transduction histidine kinase